MNYETKIRYVRLQVTSGVLKDPLWDERCTKDQAVTVARYCSSLLGTSKREVRLAVLSEILGFPVYSTKELTKWEASVLIDLFSKEVPGDSNNIVRQAGLRVSESSQDGQHATLRVAEPREVSYMCIPVSGASGNA